MSIDLQRIQIKILSNAPAALDLNPFIEIFGRWRSDKDHPAQWSDLADYAHVPRGPGIVLVGFNANFAFDMMADGNGTGEMPGVLYFAKKGLSGTHAERISAAMKSCLDLTELLIAEREFPKGVELRTGAMEIRFPDRLVTPNTAAVEQQLRPAAEQALNKLFGAGAYALSPRRDPNEAAGYSVRAKSAEPLAVLLKRFS